MVFFIIQAIEDESDRHVLSELYQKHQRLLLYKAKQYTGNSSCAEDILQDAIIRVIEKMETFRILTEAQMVAYIDRTIYHCALNWLRKESAIPRVEDIDQVEIGSEDNIVTWIHSEELSTRLGLVLERLPSKERNVLLYKYIFEYKDTEIAEILSVKPESVRMILTRARRRLKQSLLEENDDLQ